jgi:hypothetical protein
MFSSAVKTCGTRARPPPCFTNGMRLSYPEPASQEGSHLRRWTHRTAPWSNRQRSKQISPGTWPRNELKADGTRHELRQGSSFLDLVATRAILEIRQYARRLFIAQWSCDHHIYTSASPAPSLLAHLVLCSDILLPRFTSRQPQLARDNGHPTWSSWSQQRL